MGPQCGGDSLANSHDGHFGFCPANSQLYRVVVKPGALDRHPRLRPSCSWQTVPMTGERHSPLEDGTDFVSHAAGASRRIPERDCRGVVVVGHAGRAGARADRSGRQTIAFPTPRSAVPRPRSPRPRIFPPRRSPRIWRSSPRFPIACAPIQWRTASTRFRRWPARSGSR